MTKFRTSPRAVSVFILFTLGMVLFLRHLKGLGSQMTDVPQDFNAYMTAVERVRNGLNPYVKADLLPYKYSPGVLVFLSALPGDHQLSWLIFKLLSLLFWIGSVLIGARIQTWRELTLVILGVILSWKGILETLDFGQVEFFLLFVLVFAFRLLKKHAVVSGILIGILPGIKLPWAIFVFPFILFASKLGRKKVFTILSGFLLGGLSIGILIPVLWFGSERTSTLLSSWISLLRDQPSDLFSTDYNQSIWSTSYRWVEINPWMGGIMATFVVMICAYSVYRTIKSNRDKIKWEKPLETITPWLILGQLISPLSWRWASVLLVGAPLGMESTSRSLRMKQRYFLIFGVALLFLLQQNPFVHLFGIAHWTDLNRFGSVTMYWIFILLLVI